MNIFKKRLKEEKRKSKVTKTTLGQHICNRPRIKSSFSSFSELLGFKFTLRLIVNVKGERNKRKISSFVASVLSRRGNSILKSPDADAVGFELGTIGRGWMYARIGLRREGIGGTIVEFG